MDLKRLLAALQDGESWAGPALVTLLMPMLMRYATDLGSDLSEAEREAAVEAAVLGSVDNIERFDPARASFPSWVRGFLRYAIADCRRKKAGYVEVSLEEGRDIAAADSLDANGSETTSGLTWPLLQLSVMDQVIIALRDFEGLSYEACAERIGGGVNPGACRVRHHRALKRLRELLSNHSEYQPYFERTKDD